MNALQIANLIFLLIQEARLDPDATIVFVRNDTSNFWISSNKKLITISQ
jgi:hypothetical protein